MGESSSIVILPDANKAANKEESVEDNDDDEPLEEDSDSEERKKMNGLEKSDELPAEHSSSGSGSGSGGSRCMWCREVKVAFKRIAPGNRIVCSACYHKNAILLC